MATGSGIPSQGGAEGWEVVNSETFSASGDNYYSTNIPSEYDEYLVLVRISDATGVAGGDVDARINGISSDWINTYNDGSTSSGDVNIDRIGGINGDGQAVGSFYMSDGDQGISGNVASNVGSGRIGSALSLFSNRNTSQSISSVEIGFNVTSATLKVKVLGRNI